MKKLLFILTLALIGSCNYQYDKKDSSVLLKSLNEQYEAHDYFKLKSNFEANKERLSKHYLNYYNALLAHVFNQQELSNSYIDLLIDDPEMLENDSLMHRLYRIKRMNDVNSYEYYDAYNSSAIILKDYKDFEDSSAYDNLLNEQKIWLSLKDAPIQEVIKKNDTELAMHRDKVGLMNVQCRFEQDSIDFLFDTGANFSVIKRSLAEELQMKIIDVNFYVTAATGNKVASNIAIASEFYMENILIKNAVFLVFDDEDISFPQIDYYPNGAIGFPIIEAFEEMHIHNDGRIFIPQNAQHYKYNNLALEGLMPIIAVYYKKDTLNFNFDTGGSRTTLYHVFYNKYKSEIEAGYDLEVFESGSGGGNKSFEGFVLDSIKIAIADKYAIIKDVRLHKNPVYDEIESIHGNFGQDFIKQFNTMIISFKHASVLFE